jgi:hypothetical protein
MPVSRKNLLVFLLLFLAGSAIGFIIGGYTGSNFGMGIILNNALNRDARDVKTLVGALQDIHSGDSKAGIEAIETLVYDHIVVFDPVEPYPGIEQQTEVEVEAAINAAFRYRKAFPRDSRLATDSMVEAVFKSRGLE